LLSACFGEDLELLQQLAHFLSDKHPEYGRALPETIMEVRRLLEHEVDFAREQATLVRGGPGLSRRAWRARTAVD
jgi:predicted unusual protein kinase regulating ubiquinone biosynthesis (AarF/ABC1/UbiB family)